MKDFAMFCAAGVASVATLTASATIIVDEDFSAYSTTADLGAVWDLGDGSLLTAFGNGTPSLFHPGTGANFTAANTNSLDLTPVYPGAGEVLVLTGDIYDDANSDFERNTIGLRTAAGANIIEMGHYNDPSHYAIRTVLFGAGSDGAWVAFDNIVDDAGNPISNAPVAGWHTYSVSITDSAATFTLDLNGDGNINSTVVTSITQNPGFSFDILRLGGPSNLGSTSGGAAFDNIKLELIPEPATAALLGLGSLAMLRRRSA